MLNTCFVHWFQGQYSWSIITGFLTLNMAMSSKCKSDTVIAPGVPGQVLILTPLSVLLSVQFLTVIPSTGSSFGYFPRLPTLMPCPGPHVTFKTLICLLPSPKEMQSSPVAMFVLVMFTRVDLPMWIPSVFGLFPGAIAWKFINVMLLQPRTLTWKYLLSFDVMSRIIVLLRKPKPKFYRNIHKKTQLIH